MEIIEHLGVKLPIVPDAVSPQIAEFIRAGRYETREGKLLDKIIEPGERILELGGGLGFISTLAAKRPEVEGVLVYEGNPKLKDVIAETHRLNEVSGVEVRTGVVFADDSEKSVPFYVRSQFWGSSLEKREGETGATTVNIPVSAIRDVIAEFKPTMIVCDIEGGEAALFDGSALPGVRKIMMEVHQQHIGRNAMAKLFANMAKAGFHYDQDNSVGAVVLFCSVVLP